MKKVFIVSILMSILFSACATWDGLKEDSSDGWEKTKEVSKDTWESTKEVFED